MPLYVISSHDCAIVKRFVARGNSGFGVVDGGGGVSGWRVIARRIRRPAAGGRAPCTPRGCDGCVGICFFAYRSVCCAISAVCVRYFAQRGVLVRLGFASRCFGLFLCVEQNGALYRATRCLSRKALGAQQRRSARAMLRNAAMFCLLRNAPWPRPRLFFLPD